MANTPTLHIVAGTSVVADLPNTEIETIDAAEVRAELRRVLESDQFDASERNCRFLQYVVEETLAGRAERIKAYNIATIVFGRDDSFDPQLDPVVRMEARRLRRSLERYYYLVEGGVGPLTIALPKGGYIPKFRSNDADLHRSAELAHPEDCGSGPLSRGVSVLVLPFEMETADPAGYGDGFVRQLVVGLSRFPELNIFTSRTGAGRDIGRDSAQTRPPEADLVLTGNIASFSDVVKVKATLVQASSGRVVWGEVFEQNATARGVLAARDRIADCMVRLLAEHGIAVASNAIGVQVKDMLDISAYDRGSIHFFRYLRTPRRDLFAAAREHLQRQVALNPDHPESAAQLSLIYSDGHRFGFALEECVTELRNRALKMAQRAVEMSPDSSRGHHALGVAQWYAGNAEGSLASLRTAIAFNPNAAGAMAELGVFSCLRGEWAEGIQAIEESLTGSPLQTPVQRLGLCLHAFRHGRFQQALAEANGIGERCGVYGLVAQAISLVRLGRRNEARDAVTRILEISPRFDHRVLHEFGGENLQPALAAEITGALAEAGLALADAEEEWARRALCGFQ